MHGFKQFVAEDKVRSLEGKSKAKKEEPENYLDGMWRELGIDPNSVPEFIESGPVEIEDQGLFFNQAIWQVIKPIELSDPFVRIRFHKSLSPNLNQRCYRKREDGKMEPFGGEIEGKVFIIPIKKFAEMLGRGWQSAVQGGGPGGMGGGMGGMF